MPVPPTDGRYSTPPVRHDLAPRHVIRHADFGVGGAVTSCRRRGMETASFRAVAQAIVVIRSAAARTSAAARVVIGLFDIYVHRSDRPLGNSLRWSLFCYL
ncbi:Os12g0219300 [Oryza sativa Japonica Group]|uniref:Os12g0219300 protein n=1 Tax=Oryza sativa subsp. japonica TaxID=39947 RepID=A0A0P0Y874_ORYSJ|nr:Os12g0219300 [Oryza sativa Japonica Group]